MKLTKNCLLFSSIMLLGCNADDTEKTETMDAQLRSLIVAQKLDGDPMVEPMTSIETPLAQLGMQLFFSKALGGDQDVACVTCHHPLLGGGDNLSLSIGTQAQQADLLGPGRLHQISALPTVPRNAPTTFNSALWQRALFWDGRVETLTTDPVSIRTPDSAFGQPDVEAGTSLVQAQARFPVTSAAEMRGQSFEAGESNQSVREHLQARLGNYGIGADELASNQWLNAFQQGFSSTADAETLITFSNITAAIAAYEKSQLFIDSPWAHYIQGDETAIDAAQKQGAILFFTPVASGGAGCVSCHSGDFFTDEQFHVVAFPQIGEGKGNGEHGTDDFGRMRETQAEQDLYAFRTPTLLNVEVTGPYGHAGSFETLEAVVRYHLDAEQGLSNYDFTLQSLAQFKGSTQTVYPDSIENSQKALARLLALQNSNQSLLPTVDLNDTQISQLVSFLEALTDPCVVSEVCLSQWVPTPEQDMDGLQLKAVDANGDPVSL